MTEPMDPLLTFDEAAERLGVTRQRVSQIVAQGSIERILFPGRRARIRQSCIDRYIDSRQIPSALPIQEVNHN